MFEEKDIFENLTHTLEILNRFHISYEIIVVDDGSNDDSIKKAKKIKSTKIKVVGYSQNGGKGNAIKYGFKYCKGEIVAFLDSDMELDPAHLRIFFE